MSKKWIVHDEGGDGKIVIKDPSGMVRFAGSRTIAIASFAFLMQELDELKLCSACTCSIPSIFD